MRFKGSGLRVEGWFGKDLHSAAAQGAQPELGLKGRLWASEQAPRSRTPATPPPIQGAAVAELLAYAATKYLASKGKPLVVDAVLFGCSAGAWVRPACFAGRAGRKAGGQGAGSEAVSSGETQRPEPDRSNFML